MSILPDVGIIEFLGEGEPQYLYGATLSELLNAQSGGQGIFVAGRAAAYLTWRTPYKVNASGNCWRFWMSMVVKNLLEEIESGNLRQLTPPAEGHCRG